MPPLVTLRKPGLPPDMGGYGSDPSDKGEFAPQIPPVNRKQGQIIDDMSREGPGERPLPPAPRAPDMSRTGPGESFGGQPTPVRPRSPQPSAASPQPPMPAGVVPAAPPPGLGGMGDVGAMVKRRGTMLGGLGGLKGGGLGVPSNPVNLAENDPIMGLMEQLKKKVI